MPTQRTQLLRELTDRYGSIVANAFLRAMDNLRALAEIQRVTSALEAGDYDAALDALHIDPEVYDEMLDSIREGYQEAGREATNALPRRRPDGTALVLRFDGRNPVAERWLRDHSSTLVTRITEDQRSAVRTSLRDSMEAGVNPRTAALRVVGTINPVTRRREGGILGLTAQQERYVATARVELASGDPALLRNYLNRAQRDKRFDRSVLKALRDGTPVPADIIGKASLSYSNRLLKLRGDIIGRTEALTALNAAQYEAIRQAVESGKVPASSVRRIWRSAGDLRVRHTHMGLNAESVGLDEAFRSPSGARLRFPGDTALGAPASETIGCRCLVENRIDWLSNLR